MQFLFGKKFRIKLIQSKIKLDYLKVPRHVTDFELLDFAKKFKKKIHISLGMTSRNETKKLFVF